MKRACAALAGVALVAATACAPGGGDDDLTVLAAASLTDVFAAIDEQAGDLDAAFSFAGTPALLEQVRQGAPADVVAVADVTQLDALVASGDVGEPVVFARNRLVVVVSAGNPDPRVRSIDDLAEPGIAVVLAAPDVPAGRYARAALEDAGIRRGVEANVVSD
ncbi:MAG TPA: substrate-binding domain-containing protein, partial [Acidimicrobiia bacterium]|nr:substrate-binding domain-containing protein [Acidimicrobiia bacterium]